MTEQPANAQFVLCVQNIGYEVDLRVGRVYHRLPDPVGERRGFLRVIDETGDDFMFPKRCFVPVEAGHAEESTIRQAS
ncbi:hypothetical protein [Longimicrobium sp.]|jgi:hypothetical protein|uniref:hypothetical protein n=1 Tax=Longimicrobium sp. TaxID=2029185 RepID=UPI002ED933E5